MVKPDLSDLVTILIDYDIIKSISYTKKKCRSCKKGKWRFNLHVSFAWLLCGVPGLSESRVLDGLTSAHIASTVPIGLGVLQEFKRRGTLLCLTYKPCQA